MRIGIVNDSMLGVEAMRRVLTSQGEHVVVWVARDGAEGVARCARERPDLILMDLLLSPSPPSTPLTRKGKSEAGGREGEEGYYRRPHLDGVEATRRIMAASPCPIVIVTASAREESAKVFEAMGAGALDVVQTPVLGLGSASGAKHLLAKVETIRRLVSPTPWQRGGRLEDAPGLRTRREWVVCVGSSAGGPAALAKLLGGLPVDFGAAVVMVQHVDARFAAGLAGWLAGYSALPVRLVEEGDRPKAGTVLLAGRDHHLVFASPQRLGYTRAEKDSAYRPSVDVLFQSAAEHCQGVAVGVLLTGMGRDGAEGLLAMRRRGFLTIAQDKKSSAVFGMPKAAIELQAAAEILALDKIAPRLVNVFAQKATP